MREPVQIGHWLVSADTEKFRIFPKGRDGKTVPVWRINSFIYLRCVRSGALVVFKRYLHMKQWYWRDSRDKRPCDEGDILREMARMLGVPLQRAGDIAIACLTGAPIPA